MGDLFFRGRFPFIDLDSGGSVDGLIQGVELVLEKIPPDVKVIPGHGPLGTVSDLRSYLQMLRETRAAVAFGLAAGKTAEQMKEEKILAKWDSFGGGFISADRFVDTLVRDSKK